MKEITVTKWEAFDGTVFDSDSECIDYEDGRFSQLAKDRGIIFLNRDREEITPREVEQCEYLYVPDSDIKTCDLLAQIFDLFDLCPPLFDTKNAYCEEFDEGNPDACGWWVLDIDYEVWRNLRIEAKSVKAMSDDLERRTGVA